ncbi:MAG: ABC transporter permease [Eubacteriales bacterium]|nr:ABC transporter permease [Eubacteriales bacterium]
MTKYVIKRLLLMLMTMFIILTICFVLIKMLQPDVPVSGSQVEIEMARRKALGYDKPVLEQYAIYLRNVFTKGDFGTSWKIDYLANVTDVLFSRVTPTLLLNIYSLIFSVPLGLALGIFAALKKNKWQDHFISFIVMLFISVPSYVYAFIVQYLIFFKLGWLPATVCSLYDAGMQMGISQEVLTKMISSGDVASLWLSWPMFVSMLLPIISLSFGSIAGLARFTRAELTEVLTSDFMLLARAKGLTRAQATTRHALRNAMVPILPMIIGEFTSILSGSLVIERIFGVPGVGALYLQSINLLDYDVFLFCTIFYTMIGLTATIVIDLSYGFIDPRIRMGER